MPKIVHPQEIEVYYILPALRREITLALKSHGEEQKKIARLLGVTEASISHYMHSKRAMVVHFDEPMKQEIWKSAKKIKDVHSMVDETQRLLGKIRNEKVVCSACRKFSNREVPKGCAVCFNEHTGAFKQKIAIPVHASNH